MGEMGEIGFYLFFLYLGVLPKSRIVENMRFHRLKQAVSAGDIGHFAVQKYPF